MKASFFVKKLSLNFKKRLESYDCGNCFALYMHNIVSYHDSYCYTLLAMYCCHLTVTYCQHL